MDEKKAAGKKPGRNQKIEETINAYFETCREQEEIPNMAGLTLSLGYSCRQELEQDMKGQKGGRKQAALLQARTRIEEANIRAVYCRDTSSGAKFVLQTEFGYSSHEEQGFPDSIEVKAEL